jgi:hypothetical protein
MFDTYRPQPPAGYTGAGDVGSEVSGDMSGFIAGT